MARLVRTVLDADGRMKAQILQIDNAALPYVVQLFVGGEIVDDAGAAGRTVFDALIGAEHLFEIHRAAEEAGVAAQMVIRNAQLRSLQ